MYTFPDMKRNPYHFFFPRMEGIVRFMDIDDWFSGGGGLVGSHVHGVARAALAVSSAVGGKSAGAFVCRMRADGHRDACGRRTG